MRSLLIRIILGLFTLIISYHYANGQMNYYQRQYLLHYLHKNKIESYCFIIEFENNKVESVSSELTDSSQSLEISYCCKLFTPVLFTKELMELYGDEYISSFIKGLKIKNISGKRARLSDFYDDRISFPSASREIRKANKKEELVHAFNESTSPDHSGVVKWLLLSWIYESILEKPYLEILRENFPEYRFQESPVSGLEKLQITNEQLLKLNRYLYNENQDIFDNFNTKSQTVSIHVSENEGHILLFGMINQASYFIYLKGHYDIKKIIHFLLFRLFDTDYIPDPETLHIILGEYIDNDYNKTTILKEQNTFYLHQNNHQQLLYFIGKRLLFSRESFCFISIEENNNDVQLIIDGRLIGIKNK